MIIPALDLIEGEVVRLYQGDYGKQRTYPCSPLSQLLTYQQQGATFLHLVDLSGAKDPKRRQQRLLQQLLATIETPIQVGGGIRSEQDIQDLLHAGANRVVIGSTAIHHPEWVIEWLQRYGSEKLVLALDIRIDPQGNKYLALHGWQDNAAITLENLLQRYLPYGLRHVLCTDIACDGTLQGSNTSVYHELTNAYPSIAWQASGGIGSLQDIASLRHSGVQGVIVGRALLEKLFTLQEAQACWLNGSYPA